MAGIEIQEKTFGGWAPPGPAVGAYSAPQTPYCEWSGLKGMEGKGEGKKKGTWEGKGRGVEEEGKDE